MCSSDLLSDSRTAQAARDLGLFLRANGDTAAARRALAQALHIDEAALGNSAAQTLDDAASLASVSPPAAAEPLLRRAGESHDPVVAGQALSTLGGLRKSAGDFAGAVECFHRALAKAEQADGPDGATAELLLKILLTMEKVGSPEATADVRTLAELYRKTGRAKEAALWEQRFNVRRER